MKILGINVLIFMLILYVGCTNDDIDVPALQDRLYQSIQLRTVEYVYRSIIFHEGKERFLGIFPLRQDILFRANIIITAGMAMNNDFELFRDDDDASKIYVVLPAPTILSSDLDESSIYQYYIHQNSQKLDFAAVGESIYSVKEDAAEKAIASGILERAEQNAKEEITSLLNLLGFSRITFTTQKEHTIRG